jgi:hypothetical protein
MKVSKIEKVFKVAKNLCKANNTVTTLEIKNELRKNYPKRNWRQNEISQVMADFHLQGKFDYSDNGTFRVYSLAGSTPTSVSIIQPAIPNKVAKVKTPKAPLTTQRISRTKALDVIQNSNGKFFTVTFTKKDGSQRVMNGQHTSDMGISPLGYILVKDITALRKKEVTTIKSVNLQTIKSIKLNNTLFKID